MNEKVTELTEFLLPARGRKYSEDQPPRPPVPRLPPEHSASFASTSSHVRGDIGGTTSMKINRQELNKMMKESRGRQPNRMPSLSAKGWRPGSPEYPSDQDSMSAAMEARHHHHQTQHYPPRSKAYIPPAPRAQHSQSVRVSKIREKSESNNSEESHTLHRSQRLKSEEQRAFISQSEFIARNHIFLNTFLQLFIMGVQIFALFYGNWACGSQDSQDVCYTLFAIKTYPTAHATSDTIGTESFTSCSASLTHSEGVIQACQRYFWAGLGYIIIDGTGLALNLYAIVCSFGIVMLWRVPGKNYLKKFLILGYFMNAFALLFWMVFLWVDTSVDISPDPIVVFTALVVAFLIIFHFNHWVNALRKTRLMSEILGSVDS